MAKLYWYFGVALCSQVLIPTISTSPLASESDSESFETSFESSEYAVVNITADERVGTNHPACAEGEILADCARSKCVRVSKTSSSCDSACAAYPFKDSPRPYCERRVVKCESNEESTRHYYTLRCCRRCEPGSNTVGGTGIGSTNLNDGIGNSVLPGGIAG